MALDRTGLSRRGPCIDISCLFNGKRLNRTVVSHVSMLITNCAHSDGAEMSRMSPLTAKVTLDSQVRGGKVS